MAGAAIAHGHQQLDDHLLEEVGPVLEDAIQKFRAQGGMQDAAGAIDGVFRRGRGLGRRRRDGGRGERGGGLVGRIVTAVKKRGTRDS